MACVASWATRHVGAGTARLSGTSGRTEAQNGPLLHCAERTATEPGPAQPVPAEAHGGTDPGAWNRSSNRSANRSATSSRAPSVQFGLRAIGIYLVILWLASAYWAFRDMQQRSDNAILPYLAAAGIILFTPIFFIFAVWIYKIVRPHEKIGEVWERNLAEEALLAEVESIHHCPTCERRIDDEWIICPNCRTRLKRVCPNCSRLVGMDWSLCAWCGKDFERREIPAAAAIEALPRGRDATGSDRGDDAARAATAAVAPACRRHRSHPVTVRGRPVDRRRSRRPRRIRCPSVELVRPAARSTIDGTGGGLAIRPRDTADRRPVLVPRRRPPIRGDGRSVAAHPASRPGASTSPSRVGRRPACSSSAGSRPSSGSACIVVAVLGGGGTAVGRRCSSSAWSCCRSG